MWYKNANASRNLTWIYTHGSVDVHTTFAARRYQLVVNVFQASILCLFNSNDSLTVAEIKAFTKMPDE